MVSQAGVSDSPEGMIIHETKNGWNGLHQLDGLPRVRASAQIRIRLTVLG